MTKTQLHIKCMEIASEILRNLVEQDPEYKVSKHLLSELEVLVPIQDELPNNANQLELF